MTMSSSPAGVTDATWPVVTQEPALWCRRGSPPRMESMHRHNDLELNLVLAGELHYLFAGRPLVVPSGHIAMFWAAQPHGLVGSRPGDVCWVHVPLSTVLGWNLPDQDLAALARAEPLLVEAGVIGHRLESMVATWLEEYQDPGSAPIALLEIQATIRRILRDADALPTATSSAAAPSVAAPLARTRHALGMAQFVVENFREETTVADIARSAHLTPSHAMTVFRGTVGVTLGEYLTMCRVAEAQRLLLTTSMTSAEIAAEAGFGSLSSFYAHVTAACGMPPRQYRRLGS